MAGDSDPLEKQHEAAQADLTTEGALGKLQEQSEQERKRSGPQRTDEQRKGDDHGPKKDPPSLAEDINFQQPAGSRFGHVPFDVEMTESKGQVLPGQNLPSEKSAGGIRLPVDSRQSAPPGPGGAAGQEKESGSPGGSRDARQPSPDMQIPTGALPPAKALERPQAGGPYYNAAPYYDAMHLQLNRPDSDRLVDGARKRGDLQFGQSPVEQRSGTGNRESAPGKTEHPSGSGQSGQKVDAQSLGTADDELKKQIAERGAPYPQPQPAADGGIRQPSASGLANEVAGKVRKSMYADGDGPDNAIRGTKGFGAGSNPPADHASSPETKTVSSVPANANAGRPVDAPRETPRDGRIPPQPVSAGIAGNDAARQPERRSPSEGGHASPDINRAKTDAPPYGQPPQQRPADRQEPAAQSQSDAGQRQPGAPPSWERPSTAPGQERAQPPAPVVGDRGAGTHDSTVGTSQAGDRGTGAPDSAVRASQAEDRGATPPVYARGQVREDIGDKPAEHSKGSQRGDQPIAKVASVPPKEEGQAVASRPITGAESKPRKTGGDIPVVPLPVVPGNQFGGRGAKQQPASADGGAPGVKQIREGDSSSGKGTTTGGAEGSAAAAAERGGAGKVDKSGGAGSRPEPSGAKPDKSALATGEPAPASSKGTDVGSKGLGGARDSGPGAGRTGSDGTKVGGDVKISGDAAGRSGADSGKIGAGSKEVGGAIKGGHGQATIEGAGTAGGKSGTRGIDIPFVLPPRLPGTDFAGIAGSKQGPEAGQKGTAKGGGDSSSAAVAGIRGEKVGPGGAAGDKAADGSGPAGPAGTKAGFAAGEAGTRVGADGHGVPIVLPPGVPGIDIGGRGGLKPPGGTVPADKSGAGAVKPGDKGGSVAAPGKPGVEAGGKAGTESVKGGPRDGQVPPEGRGDRAPFVPVVIPPGYGFDQTGKGSSRVPGTTQPGDKGGSAIPTGKQGVEAGGKAGTESVKGGPRDGQVPEGRGGRPPFIPVAIPPGYGFDQTGKGSSRVPGADSARTGPLTPARPDAASLSASGEKRTVPVAQPADKSAGQAPGTAARAAADRSIAGQGMPADSSLTTGQSSGDKSTSGPPPARQPGDKGAHRGKDAAKDGTVTDKAIDAKPGQISGRSPSSLPGMELGGKLDSGQREWPKSLEPGRAANKHVQSGQLGEVASAKDTRDKTDAGPIDRRTAYEQVQRLGAHWQNPEVRSLITRALIAYEQGKARGIEGGISRSPAPQDIGLVPGAGLVQDFRLQLSPEARSRFVDRIDDGTTPGEQAIRPRFAGGDAASADETVGRLPSPEKSTDDRLLEFIKTNRRALQRAILAQELNPTLQDLAQIIQELESGAAVEKVGELGEHKLAADSDEGTVAADAAIIHRELRHSERSARSRLEQERQVYIVQEGDTLESIAHQLYADERIGALIHEINKDAIPSAYLYGLIIIELKPGTRLSLPTYEETRSFLEQIAGSDVVVFEYSQKIEEAEQELLAWEASRSDLPSTVNPFATYRTDQMEGMLASLNRVPDPSDSEASAQITSECPPSPED